MAESNRNISLKGYETKLENLNLADEETKVQNASLADEETKVQNASLADEETKVQNASLADEETKVQNASLTGRETEVASKECINQEGVCGTKEKTPTSLESANEEPKKKGKRARKTDGRKTKYNSEGIHKATQLDLCDCLIPNCPGCFMPCKKCSSTKCGHECRKNRQWVYENIQIEGTSINIKNQFTK